MLVSSVESSVVRCRNVLVWLNVVCMCFWVCFGVISWVFCGNFCDLV